MELKMQVKEKRVLPIVHQLIDEINELFKHLMGPLAHELTSENYERWLNDGKIGPSSLRIYIHELSKYISDVKKRQKFVDNANKILLQVQTGPKSKYRVS